MRQLLVLLVVVVLSGACGSTVPAAERAQATNDATGELDPAGSSATADVTGGANAGVNVGEAAGSKGAPGSQARRAASPVTVPAGAAPDTAPLKVGLTYIDNGSTQPALGASSSNTVNGKTAAQALVRGINAAGGVVGRKLQSVEYSWDTSSTNYNADATVACERFTKDNHLEVVLDTAFGTVGGFGQCLQKAGVLQLTNGAEGDRTTSQESALHANTRSMVHDRAYAAVLTNLAATGYLGRSNQLGVIVEQCPEIERAYSRTIVRLVADLGLKSPEEATIQCTTGFASAGPAASAVSNAILAFRQHQVDRVMFMSDYESVVLLLFGNAASSQQYHPGYLLSSNAQAGLATANIPSDQWPQLNGVGWVPTSDVAGNGAAPSAVDARCLQLAKAGGLTIANSLDEAFVYGACAPLLLLEAALGRTKGHSGPSLVQSAVNALGSSFAAPGLVANRARYSSTEHDGPDAVQVFGYATDCTCTRYRGQPQPAPA